MSAARHRRQIFSERLTPARWGVGVTKGKTMFEADLAHRVERLETEIARLSKHRNVPRAAPGSRRITCAQREARDANIRKCHEAGLNNRAIARALITTPTVVRLALDPDRKERLRKSSEGWRAKHPKRMKENVRRWRDINGDYARATGRKRTASRKASHAAAKAVA